MYVDKRAPITFNIFFLHWTLITEASYIDAMWISYSAAGFIKAIARDGWNFVASETNCWIMQEELYFRISH